jgi:hypothetical protein
MSISPEGYMPEQPFIMSRGEFKLVTGSSVFIGQPLYNSRKIDTSDANKRWAEPYADTNGISGILGFAKHAVYSTSYTYNYLPGLTDMRRDIAYYVEGTIQLPYCGTTNPLLPGSPVAPHPSGFQEWKPGMFCMGTLLTHAWTGSATDFVLGTVHVDVAKGYQGLRIVEENVSMSYTASAAGALGVCSGSLTQPAWKIDGIVFSGTINGALTTLVPNIYASGVTLDAVNPLSGQVRVKYNTTTDALLANSIVNKTTASVRYWTFNTW